MHRILKYGLIGTGAVLGVVVAGIAYVALTFNPNDYKGRLVQAVKHSTQRTLRLDGDIKMSFFPSLGVDLGKVSLSEPGSEQPFASAESIHVSLALLPLLNRQVVVDGAAVEGMRVTLLRHRDGTTNVGDLLGGGEKPRSQGEAAVPVKFDIAAVTVTHTNLTYRDEANAAQYAVKDLNIKTGRIADGMPTLIMLAANVQANQPKLDLNTQLKTALKLDPGKQLYQLDGLDWQANGTALDITNLSIKAGGDVAVNLSTQEFNAQKFSLHAAGLKAGDNLEVALDAPRLALAHNNISGGPVKLDARLDGVIGKVAAHFSLPDVQGNAQAFKASALALDLELKQPEQSFNVTLSSPLSGSLEKQQVNLGNLVIAVKASGDKLPGKSVSSEMKGSVQGDGQKQVLLANLEGGLLQSKVKARVEMKGFDDPAFNFNVDVDQFDADPYLPKQAGPSATTPQPEQPLDLSALRTLNLEGSLRVGALKAMNVKSSQVRVDVKAHKGVVNLNPVAANLYQGSLSGNLSINAQATPIIALSQNLGNINIAPLLKDALDLDVLEGRGNVAANLTMQGNTVGAMKKALNGNLALNLANGAVKGINLPKLVQGVQSLGKNSSLQTLGVNKDEKTEFSEFKASFKVNNGVAHNEDLAIKAPMLRVTGNGDIDIGNERLNYATRVTFSKTEGGGTATLPVQLSGPFASLQYQIDWGAMLVDVAKQKLETRKEELKEQLKEDAKNRLQEELKKGLKSLFR